MPNDEIARIVREVLRIANADLMMATKAEMHIRAQWGGARIYVGKAPPLGKAPIFGAGLAAGMTLREALECAGINPRGGYAYRFLGRRSRR